MDYIASASLAVLVLCVVMLIIYFYPLDPAWNMYLGFGLGIPALALFAWKMLKKDEFASAGWKKW